MKGVNTERKVSTAVHNVAKAALSLPRVAFLAIIKINVWGLASILDKSFNDSALNSRWSVAWWNLGGSFVDLKKVIQYGKNKKAFGLKIAPASIKKIYEKANVKIGSGGGGISGGGFAATVSSASAIIGALLPLLELCFKIAANSNSLPEEDLSSDDYENMFSSSEAAAATAPFLANIENAKAVTTGEELPYITKEAAEAMFASSPNQAAAYAKLQNTTFVSSGSGSGSGSGSNEKSPINLKMVLAIAAGIFLLKSK